MRRWKGQGVLFVVLQNTTKAKELVALESFKRSVSTVQVGRGNAVSDQREVGRGIVKPSGVV